MDGSAFEAVGPTHVLLATPTSDDAYQLNSTVKAANQYRLYNSGTSLVFVTFGQSAQNVTDQASIPTAAQPAFAIPLTPGAVEIFSAGTLTYLAVYTEAGSSKVYITPGRGF